MMKTILILLLFITNFAMAQTRVGLYPGELNFMPVPQKMVNDLKNDTLHIICPSYIDKKDLTEVVEQSWTISPSKIVSLKEFLNYPFYSENFWVLGLSPNLTSRKSEFGWDIYDRDYKLELSFIDSTKFQKSKQKMKELNHDVTSNVINLQVIDNSKKVIAYSWLYDIELTLRDIHDSPDLDLRNELIKQGVMNPSQERLYMTDLPTVIYKKNYFANIDLGAYKNYLSYFESKLLSNRQTPSILVSNIDLVELKNLRNQTLFVPQYLDKRFNTYRRKFYNDPKWLNKKLKKKYHYEYKIISRDTLSEMILSDIEFYYMRYTANETWQFIEIVNAATGNIIFTHRVLGSTNFKDLRTSHFKALNKAIESQT